MRLPHKSLLSRLSVVRAFKGHGTFLREHRQVLFDLSRGRGVPCRSAIVSPFASGGELTLENCSLSLRF